ncbi:MAG TPA: hypothetical protein V6C97_18585 [Oculatellaceae cyanobacterium]
MSEGKRALPVWAKFLIAIAIVAFLGVNVLVGIYLWASKTVWKNDPAGVKSSVEKMVNFKSPLSSDYLFKTAFDADFAPVKFAVIIYQPENIEIVLLQIAGNDSSLTPQRVITEHRRSGGKPVFIADGTKEVAGESMTYAIAKSNLAGADKINNESGKTPPSESPSIVSGAVVDAHVSLKMSQDAPMFAGTVLIPKPKPHYFVCAISPLNGTNLDSDLTDAFLKNIVKIY